MTDTTTPTSPSWIVVDSDGSWHGLDTSYAIQLSDEAVEAVHSEYGGDIQHYLNEEVPAAKEGTLVVWEEVRESLELAMRGEAISNTAIRNALATVEDAIANNLYG